VTQPTAPPDQAGPSAPSPWVLRFAPLVASGGAVLDVAAGGGRHARLFGARGHAVTALDRDTAALVGMPGVTPLAADLEDGSPWPLADRRFAAMVVANYLHRPLFPWLLARLQPSGLLIYETFAAGNAQFGRPRNPAFLLQPGELLAACAPLTVIAYEHGLVAPPPRVVQRLCAQAAPATVNVLGGA